MYSNKSQGENWDIYDDFKLKKTFLSPVIYKIFQLSYAMGDVFSHVALKYTPLAYHPVYQLTMFSGSSTIIPFHPRIRVLPVVSNWVNTKLKMQFAVDI